VSEFNTYQNAGITIKIIVRVSAANPETQGGFCFKCNISFWTWTISLTLMIRGGMNYVWQV